MGYDPTECVGRAPLVCDGQMGLKWDILPLELLLMSQEKNTLNQSKGKRQAQFGLQYRGEVSLNWLSWIWIYVGAG